MTIGDAQDLIHGTTQAINTLIERKGAKTALLVTQGTRDFYKIGRGNRPESYNLMFKRHTPLVSRQLTFEVEERLLADGSVRTELNKDQVKASCAELKAEGIEAVAVCFLHSYANPDHEKAVGEILAKELPDRYVSLSHEILREYREFERTSTTVVNAYIDPRMSGYVHSLEDRLKDYGFTGELSIMQSNGGVMTPDVAVQKPVTMMESGPVGGIVASAEIGRVLGFENVISFDMGGTTAKASLVREGQATMAEGYYVGGYASGDPVMTPVEVGAGADVSEPWMDGLQFNQLKIYEAGERNETLYKILRDNIRFPESSLGDMRSQIAACRLATRRLDELLDKFGSDTIHGALDQVFDESETKCRNVVSGIPDGVYEAESFHKDDGIDIGNPVRVHAKVTVKGSEMEIDLSGCSGARKAAVNSRTYAGARVAYKALTAPVEPVNEGSFRALNVIIPEGNIMMAEYPAHVHVEHGGPHRGGHHHQGARARHERQCAGRQVPGRLRHGNQGSQLCRGKPDLRATQARRGLSGLGAVGRQCRPCGRIPHAQTGRGRPYAGRDRPQFRPAGHRSAGPHRRRLGQRAGPGRRLGRPRPGRGCGLSPGRQQLVLNPDTFAVDAAATEKRRAELLESIQTAAE